MENSENKTIKTVSVKIDDDGNFIMKSTGGFDLRKVAPPLSCPRGPLTNLPETAKEIRLKDALRAIQNRSTEAEWVEREFINRVVNSALSSTEGERK